MKEIGLRVTSKDDPVPPVPPVAPSPSPALSVASSATATNDIPHPSTRVPRPASSFMVPAPRLGDSSRLVASSTLEATFRVPLQLATRKDSPFPQDQDLGQGSHAPHLNPPPRIPLPAGVSTSALKPYLPLERAESFKQSQSQNNSIYVSQIEREVSPSFVPSSLHSNGH